MIIYVCVKQVPDSTKVDIDPETMTLKRSGVDTKINPALQDLQQPIQIKIN